MPARLSNEQAPYSALRHRLESRQPDQGPFTFAGQGCRHESTLQARRVQFDGAVLFHGLDRASDDHAPDSLEKRMCARRFGDRGEAEQIQLSRCVAHRQGAGVQNVRGGKALDIERIEILRPERLSAGLDRQGPCREKIAQRVSEFTYSRAAQRLIAAYSRIL